jgi:hypothetical protein
MIFIHRTIRNRQRKSKPTCFDLVQLAEEITEEMQLLAKVKQQIHFTLWMSEIHKSGPKFN